MPASLRALPGRRRRAAGRDPRRRRRPRCACRSTRSRRALAGARWPTPLRFTTDAAESAALWNVRKGMFPAVGAMRADRHHGDHRGRGLPGRAPGRGHARPAAAAAGARLPRGHHLRPRARGQPALRLHAGLRQRRPRSSATPLHGRRVPRWSCDKYDGSLKAEHGTGRNMAPFVEMEWGAQAFALMQPHQGAVRPAGAAQSGRDPQRRSASRT